MILRSDICKSWFKDLIFWCYLIKIVNTLLKPNAHFFNYEF